ncbi:MAG: ATP-binding cassette domain-containing protein [Chloroflexota bacterium]|nr:ATP-binding cassette domain-containing protein [Chloroflexota bacterium]
MCYNTILLRGDPDMRAVEASHIVKAFADKVAVDDLSFSVDQGEMFGLIGPNGAGKTTTIRMMMDIIKPDSGEVTIIGEKLSEATKNRVGYMPEERGLYKKLGVLESIVYLASLKGMDGHLAREKADDLLERTGMLDSKKKKIEELSRGMGQIIQFIVTVIHDPQLVILDEPFSGLDPVNTELLKGMLAGLRDQGKAVILSTHQMSQVEELCDRILMIHDGHAVLYGDLREIKSRYRGNSLLLDYEGELGEVPGVTGTRTRRGYVELVLDGETTPQQVLTYLVGRGIAINRLEVATPSLNEIFLKEVGRNHE